MWSRLNQQVGIWLGGAEKAAALWHYYAEDASETGPPVARWMTSIDNANILDIELSASPTHPGNILQQRLYDQAFGLVLTSATLQALGSFDNYAKNMGLPRYANCHAVAGVFDYPNAASLQVPKYRR